MTKKVKSGEVGWLGGMIAHQLCVIPGPVAAAQRMSPNFATSNKHSKTE